MKLPKCYQPIYVITRTLCFTEYIKQYDHHHLKHRCICCFCLRFYYLFVFLDFYYKCLSLTDISWGFVLFLEQLSSRKSLDDCYYQSYFSIVGRTHETLDNRKTWDIIKVQIKTNLLIKKSTGCNRIPILRSSNE